MSDDFLLDFSFRGQTATPGQPMLDPYGMHFASATSPGQNDADKALEDSDLEDDETEDAMHNLANAGRDALDMVSTNQDLRSFIESVLRDPEFPQVELSLEHLALFNSSTIPQGKQFACGITINGRDCGKSYNRQDRFKYHINRHLGLRPYRGDLEDGRVEWFSSPNALRTKIHNKGSIICQRCSSVLPKNLARHLETKKCKKFRLASSTSEGFLGSQTSGGSEALASNR